MTQKHYQTVIDSDGNIDGVFVLSASNQQPACASDVMKMPLMTKQIWPPPSIEWRPSVTKQSLTSDINWWLTQMIITYMTTTANTTDTLLRHRRTWKGGPSASLRDGTTRHVRPPIGNFNLMPGRSWYNHESEDCMIRQKTQFRFMKPMHVWVQINWQISNPCCPGWASWQPHRGYSPWELPCQSTSRRAAWCAQRRTWY